MQARRCRFGVAARVEVVRRREPASGCAGSQRRWRPHGRRQTQRDRSLRRRVARRGRRLGFGESDRALRGVTISDRGCPARTRWPPRASSWGTAKIRPKSPLALRSGADRGYLSTRSRSRARVRSSALGRV